MVIFIFSNNKYSSKQKILIISQMGNHHIAQICIRLKFPIYNLYFIIIVLSFVFSVHAYIDLLFLDAVTRIQINVRKCAKYIFMGN